MRIWKAFGLVSIFLGFGIPSTYKCLALNQLKRALSQINFGDTAPGGRENIFITYGHIQ